MTVTCTKYWIAQAVHKSHCAPSTLQDLEWVLGQMQWAQASPPPEALNTEALIRSQTLILSVTLKTDSTACMSVFKLHTSVPIAMAAGLPVHMLDHKFAMV
jgi:hypothetical protein